MKKYLLFSLLLLGTCLLCACRSKSSAPTTSEHIMKPEDGDDSSTKTAESAETPTSAETSTSTDFQTSDVLKTENTSQTATESASQTLHFVDVHGQSYEMTINPDIPATPYTKELFLHDGHLVSYDDANYTCRLGIDVSYYQGVVDWEKVKAAGYEFAFIRVGFRGYGEDGIIKTDEMFHENMKNALAAGLDVGVYFFAQAINEKEAIEEANFVLEQLQGYDLQMPVVYDPESILHSEARTDDVTGEQFTKNTKAFCETIARAGLKPMIYCNMLWQAFELDLSQLSEFPIWYADYEHLPQTPYQFDIWQYTQEGQVDGIDGNVDINIQMLKK